MSHYVLASQSLKNSFLCNEQSYSGYRSFWSFQFRHRIYVRNGGMKNRKKHNEIQPRVNHSSSTILNDKSVPRQWPCIHMCGLKAHAANKTCWKASDFGNRFITRRDTSNTDYLSILNSLSICHMYFALLELSVPVLVVKILTRNDIRK